MRTEIGRKIMIIVNENTAGIDNLASPLDIFSSKEPYSGTERRISCFFDYDCKNKLYYSDEDWSEKSCVVGRLCGQ